MSGAKRQIFKFHQSLKRFLGDNTGATAIEYAIIAGGVSIVIVTVVFLLGNNLNNSYFTPVGNALAE